MTGVLALVTSLAYTALGLIALSELLRHRRVRGFSHFGLAFSVMALTCGPHHLIHAWRHLVEREPAHGPMLDLRVLLPNLILFASYALVGYCMARTQLARRPLLDGWSLSGVAVSAVFATCALSHLVAGLLTTGDSRGVAFDNLGVLASIYFLWAVYRLHRDSARDRNRRPLVGGAAPLGRRSPWAEQGA